MESIPEYQKCYLYDENSFEYIGESTAPISPLDLEEGRIYYIFPPNSTIIEPLSYKEGFAIIFIPESSEWFYKEDFRGKIYYDTTNKEEHKIEFLDEIILPFWTDKEPIDRDSVWQDGEWKVPFEILKERKILSIRSAANEALSLLKKDFSESEVISWSKQEQGARDLMNDPLSTSESAQFVRDQAQWRGISTDDLVAKIMNRIDAYSKSLARVIGIQQSLEDRVKNCISEYDLSLINEQDIF